MLLLQILVCVCWFVVVFLLWLKLFLGTLVVGDLGGVAPGTRLQDFFVSFVSLFLWVEGLLHFHSIVILKPLHLPVPVDLNAKTVPSPIFEISVICCFGGLPHHEPQTVR